MSENSSEQSVRVARYKPYYFKPVPGKAYFWCACGRSRNQPFCDSSHKGTGITPVKYVGRAEEPEVLFCGCKHTARSPLCDGTHNNLRDTYEQDDPSSAANRFIATVAFRNEGRLELNGHCFVANAGEMSRNQHGNTSWTALVTAANGAKFQSQFYFEIGRGLSPVIGFGDRHVVLLATRGQGAIDIARRRFQLAPEMGVYVGPAESFAVSNEEETPISLYAAVCPQADAPAFGESMADNFDRAWPQRSVAFDTEQRQRMGDRSFQLLVDKSVGSDLVTQFIGDIPLSKAAPHRHLYEETLVVLKGEGAMWTEDLKAPVRAGDIIFLPAKQIHSLQCTDPEGMVVAGVIYPGGNPNINY